MVYVCRNPKDAAVSYYKFLQTDDELKGPFEDFAEVYTAGAMIYGDYWHHLKVPIE